MVVNKVQVKLDLLEAESLRWSNEVVWLVGQIELESRKVLKNVLSSDRLKANEGTSKLVGLANELVVAESNWERVKKERIALELIE